MNSKTKIGVKTASGQARFKLLTSAAMVAMALASMSAVAGPGAVCLDGTTAPVTSPVTPLTSCVDGSKPIGTYYANSPLLRKFVDTLPGLTSGNHNTFANGANGEYIPLAEPDKLRYPGSEYFVIGVVEHSQRMHSDLVKETTQRSYVQLYPRKSERHGLFGTGDVPTPEASAYGVTLPKPVELKYPNGNFIYWPDPVTGSPTTEKVYAYDQAHYLGPIIITEKGTPVRVKFVNFLPNGSATTTTITDQNTGAKTRTVTARNGDMFLPTDQSLAGVQKDEGLDANGKPIVSEYPQNRVAFHLHGGDSPWISDGTPHQWIAASGENSPNQHGDRFMNAPDMPYPGDGAQNVFWPNDQSNRLMWYHDHTFGLTRQNVYSGAAAGYVIMDQAELDLLNGTNGITKAIPGGLLEQIVLVVQDKTFVPNDIATQDSKWDTVAWGTEGDLWYPHVYEPAQIWDKDGSLGPTTPGFLFDPTANPATPVLNPAGRWDYGIDDATGGYRVPNAPLRDDPDYGKVAFPDGTYFGGPSATPESYMDTPVVNGVAYPVLNVDPKAYRVRFLNGANDRYWNLSLWVADDTTAVVTAAGRPGTEVKMVAADGGATYNLPGGRTYTPLDGRDGGVPDPNYAGPNIIRFANEGGLLAAPVVHAASPMNGFNDPQAGFTLSRDSGDNFYLGGAERADTVIDFSQYAGKTLILYNDSSAPVPGGDSLYDYYTGGPDQTPFGGAPTTAPGFGPNTRTVMQIRVAAKQANGADPAPAYDANGTGGLLASELPKAFAASTDPRILTASTPASQDAAAVIASLTLPTAVDAATSSMTLNGNKVDLKVKTIRGITDPNFGRLIAQIGVELPGGDPLGTPLAYVDTPTDIISDGETQYWWIKNNDVDNHPMHFHLFNVQVVARVNQADGSILAPQPDETGWKETLKNWPLEDVIVAVKPKTPLLPFGLPKSVRNLDPTLPLGATNSSFSRPGADLISAFYQNDLVNNLPIENGLKNSSYDFDWEYVWHCHILGHEENDLMRPLVFHPAPPTVPTTGPTNVTVDTTGTVNWTDPTPKEDLAIKGNTANEIGFRVERAEVTTGLDANNNLVYTKKQIGTATDAAGITTPIYFAKIDLTATGNPIYKVVDGRVNTLANATSFVDQAPVGADYLYRVVSVNEGGEIASIDEASYSTAPFAPTGVKVSPQGLVSWTDASSNEIGFKIERAAVVHGTVGTWSVAAANITAANVTSFQDTPPAATDFNYRVSAVSAVGETVSTGIATLYAAPAAPSALAVAATPAVTATALTLQWQVNATNDEGYLIEASVNGGAYAPFATVPVNTTAAVGSLVTYAATVKPGTSYIFRVSAIKNSLVGYTPTTTAPVAVTTPATLVAPVVTALATATGGATINWTTTGSSGQNGFTVERCAGTATTCAAATASWTLLTTATGTATTYTDTTVLANTSTYVYRVKLLFTAIGATAPTTVGAVALSAAVTPTVAVAQPTNLTATSPTGTGVTLTWVDKSTNETSFQVFRKLSTDAGFPATALASVTRTAALGTATGGTVTYADATAVAGSTYNYYVVAVKTVGTTVSLSASSNVATVALALPMPTGLAAVQSDANINVTWVDTSASETSFEVLRTDLTPGTTALPVTYVVARTAAQGTSVNTTVTYSDVAATPGVSYSYAVRAVVTTAAVAPATGVSTYSPYTTAVNASVAIPAPTGLTATALTATSVGLNWVDNATFETGYRVDRAPVTGGVVGTYTTITTVARTATGTTGTGAVSYTDATAAAGTTYAYQVYAMKGTAASAGSNVATTGAATVATGTPTGLTAVTTSGTSVVLSWIDNSTNETSFVVTRTDTANVVTTFTVTRTATQATSVGKAVSYTDATAVVGTSYSYTVGAVLPAVAATATTPAVPAQTLTSNPVTAMLTVNVPTAATAAQTATGITIGWTDNANNELGFQIVRTGVDAKGAAVASATFNVTSTATQKTATGARSYIDTTAVPGVTYTYTVAATSGTAAAPVAGTAVATNPLSITETIAAPSAPTAVVTNGTRITVTWTDLSTNETGFLVERSTDGGLTFATLATVARTGTATTGVNSAVSYVDNLVAPVTYGQYQYRVSAVNVTGTGATAVTNAASAAVASNVVDFTLPVAPTGLTVTPGAAGSGSVTLGWTDNATNETGYTIQRATNATFTTGLVSTAVPGAVAGGTTSYVLNGLTPVGTKYFYRVAATNAVGTSGYVATTTAVAVP